MYVPSSLVLTICEGQFLTSSLTHVDFQVTEKLTNVTWDLGKRNWAGNIPVNRPGHPNDTLFFWGFEKDEGSFTEENSDKPWGIYIEGP